MYSLKVPPGFENFDPIKENLSELNNSYKHLQPPPGFENFDSNNKNLSELRNSYLQQPPPGFSHINSNNLNQLKTSNDLQNIYSNNSLQSIQPSFDFHQINLNSLQTPPGFQYINHDNLNNLNSVRKALSFQSTDQNNNCDFNYIQDIENILNYDLSDEITLNKTSDSDKTEVNNGLLEKKNSNNLFNSDKYINNDLSDSSDDEVESVLSEEDFEGTMYDSKFVEIMEYYKKFDILIKNSLDLYFINIKNRNYKFNSLEELYKFHEEFKELYERKNYLKSNKNSKRKKKESYNKRVNEFVNKYEILKIELEEILKFILNDNSKKSEDSKSSDMNFSDDIKIAIENNIKFCMEELDKYDNQFKESFVNNKHENINILYHKYPELNNIFLNFNDIYKKFKEYIEYHNIENTYIDKYNFINKEFNYLMLVKLVFEFLHYDLYYLDEEGNFKFAKFFEYFNENTGISKNKIVEANKEYNIMYNKLDIIYNKYQYFKDDEFLKEEILKCQTRYKYFKKPNLSKKNDIINFINNILNFFMRKNNSIERIREIKKLYLDIIYDLPNEYFKKRHNEFDESDLKFIKDSYENTFKKYGIQFKEHMAMLTLNYQHNKK